MLSEEGFWKEEVKKSLETYQTEVVRAIKDGYDGTEIKNWTVAGAFLYSLTVITTIGEFYISIHLINFFLIYLQSYSLSFLYLFILVENIYIY